MFEGIEIDLGGKKYTVPPLNLARLKKALPILESIKSLDMENPGSLTMKQADAVIQVIHLALSRNYPEMTEADVEEAVDLGNLMKIIPAIMGLSGLRESGEKSAGSP